MKEAPENKDSNDQVLHRYVWYCGMGGACLTVTCLLQRTIAKAIHSSGEQSLCRAVTRKAQDFCSVADGSRQGTWPRRGWRDIYELDNLLTGLLECRHICDSWVREEGVSPSRSRRCEWGRNPWKPLSVRRETYLVKRIS